MMVILALLAMPFLGAAALAIPLLDRVRFWADLGVVVVTLAIALSLPWRDGPALPLIRAGGLGALTAILVAVAAVAPRAAAAEAFDQMARLAMLGFMLLAAVSGNKLLTAAALTLATGAALAPRLGTGWYRVPLSGAALGLLLFGAILPLGSLAVWCALLGLAALAWAAPALLPLLPLLALRFAGPELVAVGLAGLLLCAVRLLGGKDRPPWAALGQAAAIGVAFGLRSEDAVTAGLMLWVLLVLSQAARDLARGQGLAAILADAGLVGLPPFGTFAGLALVVLAAARQSPWLLVPLLIGLAGMGWAAIRRLPTPKIMPSDRRSLAWVPLAAALLVGFCLPAPCIAWLRAIAVGIGG